MNMIRRLTALLLMIVLCAGAFVLPASAATTMQNGLVITLETEKEAYEKGEPITAILSVKNTNSVDVSDVTLQQLIPEGYALAEDCAASVKVQTLKAGSTKELKVVLNAKEEPKVEALANQPEAETMAAETAPEAAEAENAGGKKSGSAMIILVILIVLIIVLAVVLVLVLTGKWKRFLSLLLCAATLWGMLPHAAIHTEATQTEQKTVEIFTTVLVDGEQIRLEATVSYHVPQTTCTVTFESNYGSEVEPKVVEKGKKVTRPWNPTRKGYTFLGWFTDKSLTKKYDFSQPVNEDLTLYAGWQVSGSSSGNSSNKETTPTTPSGIYTVSFNLNYATTEKNPQAQSVKRGELAEIPAEPSREGFLFAGWFTERNPSDWTKAFDFNTPIQQNLILYGAWVDMTTDRDTDGLTDDLEDYMGTRTDKDDTDDDGLNDYQDKILFDYDPTKRDTDGDGIPDGEEDHDGDGLTNLWELENGTNPIVRDTDLDELNDYDEIYKYGTDPLKADTDGDGAGDGDEIAKGTDPLSANGGFREISQGAEISKSVPVALDVEAVVNGNQVGSLEVTPATSATNPGISATIPGYLGSAYDITVDGQPQSAVLTFRYDPSLGTIGENFQPRVYYFDETTRTLEELPNQIVSEGKVTVTVSHFSTYILLNKVEFEKVWSTEIKGPGTENTTAKTLKIAFVIDVSGSMSGTNIRTVKTVMNSFIDSMGDEDKAGIVKFESYASVAQSITSDKTALRNAVNNLYASGGTSIRNGVSLGIDQLLAETSASSANVMTAGLEDAENIPDDNEIPETQGTPETQAVPETQPVPETQAPVETQAPAVGLDPMAAAAEAMAVLGNMTAMTAAAVPGTAAETPALPTFPELPTLPEMPAVPTMPPAPTAPAVPETQPPVETEAPEETETLEEEELTGEEGVRAAQADAGSDNTYDVIILLTDGQDSSFNSYWNQYAQTCKNNNIVAYSIGIGSGVSSSHLTNFAKATGGKYYHATVAGELEEYFEEIKGETVDYTTDSNDDGISDYYTKLIFEGKLPLSNGSLEFMGYDFNYDKDGDLSRDYDGDGVKNGDELLIEEKNGRVYMYKKSDPTMIHSDFDGISDYAEHANKTDPLVNTYAKNAVDYPKTDSNFTYVNVFLEEDKWWNEGAREIWSSITFNWSHQDEAKSLLTSFFEEFANLDSIEDVSDDIATEMSDLFAEDLIGQLVKAYKDGSLIKDVVVESIQAVKRWQAAGRSAKNLSPDKITQLKAQMGLFKYKYTFRGFSKMDKIELGVGFAVDEIADIVNYIQAYSAVIATETAFRENQDVLKRIKANDDAKEKFVTRAAEDIMLVVNEEYSKFKAETVKDFALATTENIANLAVGILSKANPYVLAINLLINVLDFLTPATAIAEATYCLYVVDEIVLATKDLFKYKGKTSGYYDIYDEYTRHMELMICARIWGGEFAKTITGHQHYWGFFNDNRIRQEYADAIDYENSMLEGYLKHYK